MLFVSRLWCVYFCLLLSPYFAHVGRVGCASGMCSCKGSGNTATANTLLQRHAMVCDMDWRPHPFPAQPSYPLKPYLLHICYPRAARFLLVTDTQVPAAVRDDREALLPVDSHGRSVRAPADRRRSARGPRRTAPDRDEFDQPREP